MTSVPVEPEVEEEGEVLEEAKQKLGLAIAVDSPSACQRHVTVTVPREDIDRYFANAVGDMMSKAAVPGFRAGRAPRKLVESHFRREIKDQIKGAILLDSMNQITEEQEFSAISEPDFDFESVTLPDDGPMTFEFDLEVRPDFELPEWKGLTIERPVRDVSTELVDQRIREHLKERAALTTTQEPADEGDTLVADLTFRHGGQEIARRLGETLVLRQKLSFQDGLWADFGKVMKGCRAGEERHGTFPVGEDAAQEALRGETVEVDVSVQEVKRPDPLELRPEHAASLGGFEDLGELRDYVKQSLERQIRYQQSQAVRRQITSLLTEASDWDLPPNLLRRQSQRELDRAIMELRSSGFSEVEINSHANLLRQNSQRSTARALKEHFILERIAEAEQIDASDEDFDAEILRLALQSQDSPRSIRARYEKRGLMDALRNQIVENKVIDLIQSQARFKDVPYTLPREETTAIDFAIAGADDAAIPVAKHAGDPKELLPRTDRL